MSATTHDELRLKVATYASADLADSDQVYKVIWEAVNRACASCGRVPIDDSLAPVLEPDQELWAKCPEGFRPFIVTVRTVPAIVAA